MDNSIFGKVGRAQMLALVIYGEARSEGVAGMASVGAVVIERARRGGWWGRTIHEVALSPWQFSCFNEGDPNRRLLLEIAADPSRAENVDKVYGLCCTVARALIAAEHVAGATHYHTRGVSPDWKDKLAHVADVGTHHFYREG